MKTINGNEIEVGVDDIEPFVNEKYIGFKILWSGNIGFGEYTIYKVVGEEKWYADSEYMDTTEDKEFLEILLKDFLKQLEVH